MGFSRASKDLLMKAYARHDLSKALPKLEKEKKERVRPETDLNSMTVMQRTLTGVRKGGYKGANWMR